MLVVGQTDGTGQSLFWQFDARFGALVDLVEDHFTAGLTLLLPSARRSCLELPCANSPQKEKAEPEAKIKLGFGGVQYYS